MCSLNKCPFLLPGCILMYLFTVDCEIKTYHLFVKMLLEIRYSIIEIDSDIYDDTETIVTSLLCVGLLLFHSHF